MRKKFIAGNWKMNKTISESIQYIQSFTELVKDVENVDIVLCPPFISLPYLKKELNETNIKIGAQNMFYEDSGAFTGEISPLMIKDMVDYVIIGHSERRNIIGETDEIVNKKIKKALEHGLSIIFCIGEKLEENEANFTNQVVESQIRGGLTDITTDHMSNIIIAYEPVWAIGTGKTATPDYAENVHQIIRNLIREIYGDKIAEGIRIIYGGSVKPDNIKGLIEKENIDGALPGGASLDPVSFAEIIKGSIS